ncbi:MAG: DNA primase, partial [Bacteroidota bacterium]
MGRIPTHIVDQIYNVMDIVEVVSDYMPLKKRGANYWALSPFSNEKTPSFAVNPVKGIFKDFSSQKGGNAITFLMEMEGYDYVEALKHLAKRYNIEIEEEEDNPEAKIQRDKRESLFIVNEFAARWFQEQLTQTEVGKNIGLSYFKERGLLQTTIDTFQLGYAPDSWDSFVKAAEEKQYNEEYLTELGLCSRSQKTDKLLDRFRDRVMFPISNQMGKIVGFGGRIMGDRKDVGKYINSPESSIYHKSQILYGLHLAKKAIREKDLCILTEGYMDVILLYQNGIQNVVASS